MTIEAVFTIKNYRCFEDSKPLKICIGKGFNALVGQNNSGKSSFLKLFFELRILWQYLGSNSPGALVSGNKVGIGYNGLHDNMEIFSDTNDRPLSIDINLRPINHLSPPYLSHIHLFCDRKEPTIWQWQFYYGEDGNKQIRSVTISNREVPVTIDNKEVDCSTFTAFMQDLSHSMYIGPFRNAINQGAGDYFDLAIGTSFIDTWNSWKTGPTKSQNLAISKVTDDIRSIFDFKSLEINASMKLNTLQLTVDNKPYKLGELGAGLAQFIIVLGNAAIKEPTYILIDEPELNLHPSLQIDFLTSLASYASKGVIFATHSIGLARATGDRIYSFIKKQQAAEVRPFEQTQNYAEFLGEMSFSAYRDMGFTSVLLVEGVKDVKTVQQFLRKINKDHQIVILPLGGDQLATGGIEMELGELKRISSNISAIVDSERSGNDDPPAVSRQKFSEICAKLGFRILVTERRSIENYFADRAIKAVFGDKYGALGHYAKLSECLMPWSKSDNWRIAREMHWDEIKETDIGRFLEQL